MYKYTHFIPENIAPAGAKRIGIYDKTSKRIGSFALGNLTPPKKNKLYSFCALADVHITYETSNEDFQRALTFAENNCDFTCVAGDLTDSGAAEYQLAAYKNIVDSYALTKPVYAIPGNHENYSNYSYKYLQKYTGKPLYYSFTKGDDVFIMVGHYGGYAGDGIGWKSDEFVSLEELQWLYETLEENRNKRCFVFNHTFPHEHGVGDPNDIYTFEKIWKVEDNGIGQAYINLLRHYKNAILFHGHSHSMLELQNIDKKANYSEADGYKSVHIPSLSVPRDFVGGELINVFSESEGYIVDVYDDCIILNGRDFIDNKKDGNIIPVAIYKINTPLKFIEEGTFSDSTGIITRMYS